IRCDQVMSHPDSRKRKADSSPDMGNNVSTLLNSATGWISKKLRFTGGAEPALEAPSPAEAAAKTDETEDNPSSSEIVDDSEVKAEEAPATPKTPVKNASPSVKLETVRSSPSSADDDGPPDLSRQDDGPREELPLDTTPESSPEPVKKVKKVKKEETEDEEKKEQQEAKVLQKQTSSSSLTRRRKKTIADMGYYFNDEGKLRMIEGDAGFKFTTQKAYEELGDLIGERVYEMMEELGLKKQYLEVGRNRRFYFVSPDYHDKERILVLIHGSGVVKAGQWARKLIINESLERGTQLEYIKRALAKDWGVVVLNYNEKCVGHAERCHAPDAHGREEWAHALNKAPQSDIIVVAHSYGGSIISDAVRRMHRADDERVLVVALTDSWFSEGSEVYAVNWNTTKRQLHRTGGTWQMYSGDDTHEGTSAACINACFTVLEGVDCDTTIDEFHDLLEAGEKIIKAEYKEKNKKKQQGDSVSAKSLELEGKKEEKEDQKENAAKKKEEEVEEGEEKEKEKKDEGDAVADDKQMVVHDDAAAPERNPADNEEDTDEGVERDASTPGKSDAEN
ncbi:hypothetical protein PMAYCL1PPCAC_10114, partial [Pristionchus mayeri]